MKNNNFSLFLGIIFGVAAIVALLLFGGVIKLPSSASKAPKPTVVVWGTIDANAVSPLIKNYNANTASPISMEYTEVSEDALYLSLIKSLADNNGPDVLIMPERKYFSLKDRLLTIPYLWNSQTSFNTTYVDYASAYLTADGIRALPILIDPLVLYYNRDLLSDAGYSNPMTTWDELYVQAPDVIRKDRILGISRALIALGGFSNVIHAKEVLVLLMLQSNNPISLFDTVNTLKISLDKKETSTVLQFFNQFSNPLGDYYTWNTRMTDSRSVFLAGDMLYYIGYASELFDLRTRNPNLNYGITLVPQIKDVSKQSTYGNFIIGTITTSSKNQGAAFAALSAFASRDFTQQLSINTGLVPARRDLLVMPESVSYGEIFQKSGLIASDWFDPDPVGSANVFQEMVSNSISGRLTISEAISRAEGGLINIINSFQ